MIQSMPPAASLTQDTLLQAVQILAGRDPDLADVVEKFGPPPLWARQPGFATLMYIILEQQVSLASARAAFARLTAALTSLTPVLFLDLDDPTLKAIGFSRQKAAYGRHLARAILSGEIDLPALHTLPDEDVRLELIKLKGIGRWSADIYLMEALLRPNIWPTGDLALASAVQRVKRLESAPASQELEIIGEAYNPWRAVAARLFWHFYLSTPGKARPGLPGGRA